MLVLKVELWPHGDAAEAKSLGIVAIANVGQVSSEQPEDYCKYDVELQDNGTGRKQRTYAYHFRRHGWQDLVYQALRGLQHG